MKIKRSELNSLILEVAQNNEISKGIALIIDKQGCDTDEAITIYIKDNPNVDEKSVTQSLVDFPISNGMDRAFMSENVDEAIDDVLKELDGEEDEDILGTDMDEPIEPIEPEEAPVEDELGDDLMDKSEFNSNVQQVLETIHKVINEPREYYSLLNGHETPEGTVNYPGILKMVVVNPREKRRVMRTILGKRIGDMVMDHIESESFNDR